LKSLYVTSVERYSGKTATCLVLGKSLQARGYKVGYLKPLSLQPWRIGNNIADEDALFVKKILQLPEEAWELSPVVVTPEYMRTHLKSGKRPDEENLIAQVKEAFEYAAKDVDILLLEGGASLREGYSVGLPTPLVAKTLRSQVLIIIRYKDGISLLDDALASQFRLGDTLAGILINRAPAEEVQSISELAKPYLEIHNIPVYGIIPEVKSLAALTVQELIISLDAEVLTRRTNTNALVENLTVGAMTAETALSRFRKQPNKAVITGGDRTDIQLAALETSTKCLILTGNLRPSPLVVKQAEEFGVTIMLVRLNTMETIEKVETIYGKTRLGQEDKLVQFEKLLSEHFDFQRWYETLGL